MLAELLPTAAPVASGELSAVNTLSSVLAEASNVITSIWCGLPSIMSFCSGRLTDCDACTGTMTQEQTFPSLATTSPVKPYRPGLI